MEEILNSYLHTALWTEELEGKYSYSDAEKTTLANAERDVKEFVEKAGVLLDCLDMSTVGHDFWLTRNGHGAGFWDGEQYSKEVGKKLTEISKTFKEVNIFENGKTFIIE